MNNFSAAFEMLLHRQISKNASTPDPYPFFPHFSFNDFLSIKTDLMFHPIPVHHFRNGVLVHRFPKVTVPVKYIQSIQYNHMIFLYFTRYTCNDTLSLILKIR